MRHDASDSSPPWTVSMKVTAHFTHTVTLAENIETATDMVTRQVELFMAKAKAEAQQSGMTLKCDYLVTY